MGIFGNVMPLLTAMGWTNSRTDYKRIGEDINMSHTVKAWSLPRDYAGATWEGWYSAGFGQSRDSDVLERSNFHVASTELLKLAEDAPRHEISAELLEQLDDCLSVQVVRENHWAVGWVEWIAVHGSNAAALECARELCASANNYPPLDESHWSQMEHEEAGEVWAKCYSVSERIEYIRAHRSQFEFNGFADLIGCVRGKYFAGYASELIG